MPDPTFHVDLDRLGPDHPLWSVDTWDPGWRRFDRLLAHRWMHGPVTPVAFPSPYQAALAFAWLMWPDLPDDGPFASPVRYLVDAGLGRTERAPATPSEDHPFGGGPAGLEWAIEGDLADLLGHRRAREVVDAMTPGRFWDLGDVMLLAAEPLPDHGGDLAVWADGWNTHLVSGWAVPRSIIHDPSLVTPTIVLAEPNVERRRVLFDLVDRASFVDAAGGTIVHADDTGTLWQTTDPTGLEPHARFVEVVDATALPDGSRRRYWLRVPPDVATAHAAVAWTFNLDPADYHPTIET